MRALLQFESENVMAFAMTLAVQIVYGIWAMLQFEIKNDGDSHHDDGGTIVYGMGNVAAVF